jgi:hypothetical protein
MILILIKAFINCGAFEGGIVLILLNLDPKNPPWRAAKGMF